MKKKLICLLLVCLLIPALCVSVLAEEEEYAQWIISEDGEELSLDGKTYTWYPLAYGDIIKPEERFIYENEVENPVNGDELTVIINPDNPHMVFLVEYEYRNEVERVYVTEEGRRILDAYVNREFAEYLLTDDYDASVISSDMAAQLDAQTENQKSVEVTQLRERNCYEIVGYDETHTVVHTHGAIYLLADGYYYINYDALDNTHFDSNGNFSYRSGSVTLVKLGEKHAREISDAIGDMDSWSSEFMSELETDEIEVETDSAEIVFFVLSVIGGLVIPVAPLVLGLVFARSKKSVNPHKWYLLSSLAALWIILAAVIVMMVITPA